MTEPQTFRSAFNGFHREDVVNHIAYMTAKHDKQVNQLRAEADSLRSELEALRSGEDGEAAIQERVAELEETVAIRDAELASARQALEEANRRLEEQTRELDTLRSQMTAAATAAPVAANAAAGEWGELRALALRRAEVAENDARARINELYDDATEALRAASAGLGATTDTFELLAEKFRADLVELMEAVKVGRGSLNAAAATLDCLRPEVNE